MDVAGDGQRRGIDRADGLRESGDARKELARRADLQAKEVLDLRGGNQERDAIGESQDDRSRDELDRLSETGDREHDKNHTRHHRDHEQAREPVLRHDARDDDDKRAGRARDLNPRAAKQRDDEAAHDGGVDAGLRRHARRDAEGHREGQSDDTNRDARDEIPEKRGPVVASSEFQELRSPDRPGHPSAHRARTRFVSRSARCRSESIVRDSFNCA
jgi:hypothetical protein